jgi:hypothetical protein
MKQIDGLDFPQTESERESWTPRTGYRALDSKVLVVFRSRIEGAWAAYVGAVEGRSHRAEWPGVLDSGTKLPEHLARGVWGCFENVPYAE